MIKNEQMITEITEIVEQACRSEQNHAKYSAWTHHIVPAVAFGKQLAEKLGADIEIVEISSVPEDKRPAPG